MRGSARVFGLRRPRGRLGGAASAVLLVLCLAVVSGLLVPAAALPVSAGGVAPRVRWTVLSSTTGEMPVPPGGVQQTSLAVADLDVDGDLDVVVGSRNGVNSVVWYRNSPGGWDTIVIDTGARYLEAQGVARDVDRDGYPDVVIGDNNTNVISWWRNPGPGGWGGTWPRYVVKNTGAVRHHDMRFGDFDGDGRDELAFWNQGSAAAPVDDLFVASIPVDPTAGEWPRRLVYDATTRSEGLAVADIDVDGRDDIVIGGGWLRLETDGSWRFEVVDPTKTNTQVAVGQLVTGGRPEIVAASGDVVGGLDLFRWTGTAWERTSLLGGPAPGPWRHGHSVDIGDVDLDGSLDVFSAEMALGSSGDARSVVWFGDGTGGFAPESISSGVDNHVSVLADIDGDQDLDVVSKPFDDGTPAMRFFRNEARRPLDRWAPHVIGTRTGRSIFTLAGDVDGDGDADVVTGASWFVNPGTIGGPWNRRTIGTPLTDAALLRDLDGDGDLDVFGTSGAGATGDQHRFAWAANDGVGGFTVRTNIAAGAAPSFLQGVAARVVPGAPTEIWLSWHDAALGIDRLSVPADPTSGTWDRQQVSATSQGEQIAFADLDGDGDEDLLQGQIWLRNDADGASWPAFALYPTVCCTTGRPPAGSVVPDRVVAADMNRDGRIDAVVSQEFDPQNAIAWYEQPVDPTGQWPRHVITAGGPLSVNSLDVGDLDGDGDLDVVAAEHDPSNGDSGESWVIENVDGTGTNWRLRVILRGNDSHDGMQLADLDRDGDQDIHTIGWAHDRVLILENLGAGAWNVPGWWHPGHRYRLDVTMPGSTTSTGDTVGAVKADLGAALAGLGGSGAIDPSSVRVVEVDASGARSGADLAAVFTPAADFDPTWFAVGEVKVRVPAVTPADRFLHVYFDTVDAGLSPGSEPSLSPVAGFTGRIDGSRSRAGAVSSAGAWDGQPRPVGTGVFVTVGGAVTIEAEHFHQARRGSTVHTWQPVTAPAGLAGSGAVAPLPDSGRVVATGFQTASPSLRYRVKFAAAGTYTVWLRGRAPDTGGDTVHVGLDGVAAATADRINRFPTAAYGWTRNTADGVTATLNVPTAGEHTVDVWMNEDGLVLDRLHLTRTGTAPSGIGPVESPRDGSLVVRPPVARFSATPAPLAGTAPLTVDLDGSGSTDPDGAVVTRRWDLGDGTTATGTTARRTYTVAGTYTVTLTAVDDHGAEHVTAAVVTVRPGGLALTPVAASAVEGAAGTTTVVRVRVAFSRAAPAAGSFVWQTVNGTAVAPGDYVARAPTTVAFAAGTTVRYLNVTIRGDATREANETFTVLLSNPVNATLAVDRVTVTVVNDD